jgi:hypothetical protein
MSIQPTARVAAGLTLATLGAAFGGAASTDHGAPVVVWVLAALVLLALATGLCWLLCHRNEPGEHRATGRAQRAQRDPHDQPLITGTPAQEWSAEPEEEDE